jgi:mono/diheme cytochrome c family protein
MLAATLGTRSAKLVLLAALAMLLAPAPASAGDSVVGDAAVGKVAFILYCSPCHGETGKGDGPAGIALDPPPRDFTTANFKFDTNGDGMAGSDADLKDAITKGGIPYNGSPLMAPWLTFTDTDVANLIAHIRTLKQ